MPTLVVGMCVDTEESAAWPNKFGHGTPDSLVSATETSELSESPG
jgi:hypothetical protein